MAQNPEVSEELLMIWQDFRNGAYEYERMLEILREKELIGNISGVSDDFYTDMYDKLFDDFDEQGEEENW